MIWITDLQYIVIYDFQQSTQIFFSLLRVYEPLINHMFNDGD